MEERRGEGVIKYQYTPEFVLSQFLFCFNRKKMINNTAHQTIRNIKEVQIILPRIFVRIAVEKSSIEGSTKMCVNEF